MAIAETKALIAEIQDRADVPMEDKRRLLAALKKEHARTVQFIRRLKEDIQQTAEHGDLELVSIKRSVLEKVLPHDAEFRMLMGQLTAEIQAAERARWRGRPGGRHRMSRPRQTLI